MAAVAVLIVTCPCALSLAAPVTLLAAAGSLARRGVLVQRLQALESLAGVDTVVFDKTGTLTEDRLQVGAVRTRAGVSPDQALQWAAALARHSLHPVARAVHSAADAAALELLAAQEVQESMGRGLSGCIADASGASRPLRLGSAVFCASREGAAPGALDGIAPAPGRQVHLADDEGWVASFTLHEALRADALESLQALQAAGLAVILLSGDQDQTVQAMAQRLGLTQARGACSPQDKLDAVRGYQAQGHRVLMVGDGLNDGPVLAGADVSVAMGQAVPLAQARADVVLLGSQLPLLVQLVGKARLSLRVVRQNLLWAALYNALCVPLAVAGWLPAWLAGLGMAASSLLVIANAARLAR